MTSKLEIYRTLVRDYLSHESISQRAHQLWVEEGHPEDRAEYHWTKAHVLQETAAEVEATRQWRERSGFWTNYTGLERIDFHYALT